MPCVNPTTGRPFCAEPAASAPAGDDPLKVTSRDIFIIAGGSVAIVAGVMGGSELLFDYFGFAANGPARWIFFLRGIVNAVLLALWTGWAVLKWRRRLEKVRDGLHVQQLQLAEQTRRAEQAAGLAALSRILAHELRNPLNTMMLQGHLVRKTAAQLEGPTAERLAGVAQLLEVETARVDRLVEDYQQYTHAAPMLVATDAVSLAEVVRGLAAEHEGELKARGIVLKTRLGDGLPAVCGDRPKLRQLVHQLLHHSMDLLAKGGCIDVDVTGEKDDVILVVSDDGPGFADPDAVLRPFYVASGGTGLGLAIARDIVRGHGGEISASNGPAGGARIRVRLPRGSTP